MSSIILNFAESTPCTFNYHGKIKFGVQTKDIFVWITRGINPKNKENPFQTICSPIQDPQDKKELVAGTTKDELESMGLHGFSLEMAKQWVDNIKLK